MLKFIRIAAALAVVLMATGCASVPMASPEQDAAAKTFVVKPNKANVYVYRNESFGAAVKMPVALNGRLVGDTAAKTYMLLEVDPGKHTLVSKTENDSILDITAEAGNNYFVWQEVKMGAFAARSQLQLVSPEVGQNAVKECSLIQTAQ